MPKTTKVHKLVFWRTKSPYVDRWDVEIIYEDRRRERRLYIGPADAASLVKRAIERTQSERKKVKS